MKKLIITISIISITAIAFGQNKDSVRAYIEGYKTNDTIQIDNLLIIGELSVDNNLYSIASFKLVFMGGGFLSEYKSNSNKLTDEMRNALTKLKSGNSKSVKVLFEDIVVITPQNTKSNLGILLFKVKIK